MIKNITETILDLSVLVGALLVISVFGSLTALLIKLMWGLLW